MIWKDIPGFLYCVSDTGLVKNKRTGKILTPMRVGRKRKQYSEVALCVLGSTTKRKVAHLVLDVFVGPRPIGAVARHINDDTTNNALLNLVWGTPAENANDVRHNKPKKLTPKQALEIRRRRLAGEFGRALAKEFSVSEQTICDVVKNRTHHGG